MTQLKTILALVCVAAGAAVAAAWAGGGTDSRMSGHTTTTTMTTEHMAGMSHASGGRATSPAAELRVQLDALLGEHALLAVRATQRGYSGGKDFPAIAKQLDRNSVAIADLIGTAYGKDARNRFLDGKFLWRDHIRFFVQYTQALAKKDGAGQKEAVANLMTYVKTQAAFFSRATGLPKQALANGLTAHILQLKGALDAYAKGQYGQSATLAHAAYEHMWMTADELAAAIARQKSLSLAGPSRKAVDLRVTLDKLLGEHALLAVYATQSGVSGAKDFTAIAKQLDQNSVAISNAVGSVYGKAAAAKFLNGSNLWRDHIRFFVQYTQAVAKKDEAGQKAAVAKLMRYVNTQAGFFASAIGLPRQEVANDLTAHVLQLKGQLDAYARGQHRQALTLTDAAYGHMMMTGELLARGIAKQKGF
jgi:hypothetical protein